MTAPRSPYFIAGVQLVNTGGELCEACGVRKAIGSSINGHLLCPRCAGLHAQLADELAQEIEASKKRRAEQHMQPVKPMRRASGDSPRAEYDRAYYRANREKKIEQGKRRWKNIGKKRIRSYFNDEDA